MSSHISVHRVGDDYPEAELLEALKGQDVVISTIATQAVLKQKTIIDAAIKVEGKHFVPSEFGLDTQNEQGMAVLPQVFKPKVEIVEYLKSKEKKDGLRWTAFVTGSFFETGIPNFMGYNLAEHTASILNRIANRYLFVDSFTVSQNDILASFEKVTGAKWQVTYLNAEEEKKAALEKLSRGNPSGIPALIRYVTFVNGHGGNYMDYEESANKLLSLPKMSLDEVVARIVKSSTT